MAQPSTARPVTFTPMPGNATDSPSPSADYPAGTMLGERYRLERKVGTGGMAQVWEASDLVLDRRVAVKILHPHLATDTSVTRFRREAIAAARLAHPNVVSIFDTISADGVEAIVMELVDGTTLRRHLDRHERLSPDDALHIGTSVCDALAAAHGSHLVHRDIKPANILLCRDGRVKIADFGIAKAAVGDGLTREGTLVGTAAYLAPEQVEGLGVDGRTDLYALGLVLYEALTGSLPFTGDSDAAVALARLRVTPPNAHRVRSAVPRATAGVIAKSWPRTPTTATRTPRRCAGRCSRPAPAIWARWRRCPSPNRVATTGPRPTRPRTSPPSAAGWCRPW